MNVALDTLDDLIHGVPSLQDQLRWIGAVLADTAKGWSPTNALELDVATGDMDAFRTAALGSIGSGAIGAALGQPYRYVAAGASALVAGSVSGYSDIADRVRHDTPFRCDTCRLPMSQVEPGRYRCVSCEVTAAECACGKPMREHYPGVFMCEVCGSGFSVDASTVKRYTPPVTEER